MTKFYTTLMTILLVLVSTSLSRASYVRSAAAVGNLPDVVGTKLANEVIKKLGDKPKAWVLFAHDQPKSEQVKVSENFLRDLLGGIRAADRDIPLVGCWTRTGMFAFGAGEALTGDVLLVGLTGEGLTFKVALSTFKGPADLADAGRELAQRLKPKNGSGLMVFITDSVISHDGSYSMPELYAAMQEVLGPQVGIIGGNAAYLGKPVYFNDTITANGLAGLMISGRMAFKIVQEPGKEAISPPLTITKLATPKEIVELDGQPWADIYKKYLKDYVAPDVFDEKIRKGGGAFGWISRRYPHAIIREHGQLYVRLAHGLWPWGKGTNLPCECYALKVGEKMVITRASDDQVGCFRSGMKRLKAGMPAGKQLFLLFPCESNGFLMEGRTRRKFFRMVQSQLPEGATAFGFMPCGEHASVYEPDKDKQVCEARYHQLSYPMAVVAATSE